MYFNADPKAQDEVDEELEKLLSEITRTQGACAVVVIGFDGTIFGSKESQNIEADLIAEACLAIYMNTKNSATWMGRGVEQIQSILCKTEKGTISISDWSGGIVAVLKDGTT